MADEENTIKTNDKLSMKRRKEKLKEEDCQSIIYEIYLLNHLLSKRLNNVESRVALNCKV